MKQNTVSSVPAAALRLYPTHSGGERWAPISEASRNKLSSDQSQLPCQHRLWASWVQETLSPLPGGLVWCPGHNKLSVNAHGIGRCLCVWQGAPITS